MAGVVAHRALWVDEAGKLSTEPVTGRKIAVAKGAVIPPRLCEIYGLSVTKAGKVTQKKNARTKELDGDGYTVAKADGDSEPSASGADDAGGPPAADGEGEGPAPGERGSGGLTVGEGPDKHSSAGAS